LIGDSISDHWYEAAALSETSKWKMPAFPLGRKTIKPEGRNLAIWPITKPRLAIEIMMKAKLSDGERSESSPEENRY
jgi:hypothetical protein